ncbi:hypothetical protein ACFPRL_14110 [Pseudoclavibacter helvolus]
MPRCRPVLSACLHRLADHRHSVHGRSLLAERILTDRPVLHADDWLATARPCLGLQCPAWPRQAALLFEHSLSACAPATVAA